MAGNKPQDRNRRPKKSSPDKKPSRQKIQKTWIDDLIEQFSDVALGPFMDWVVYTLPQSWFDEGTAGSRLMDLSKYAVHLLSYGVARGTDLPNWVDNIRTRVAAAWSERVSRRMKGELAATKGPSDRVKGVLAPVVERLTNFMGFFIRLDDAQWSSWYAGIQELDEPKRRRLISLFSGLNERQAEKLVYVYNRRGGKSSDWGLFFQIADDMGLLEGDDETDGEKQIETTATVTQKILALEGDGMENVRTTMISFLKFVTERISPSAYKQAIEIMAKWEPEDFKRLADLPDHEERVFLLLGRKPREEKSETEGGENFVERLMSVGQKVVDIFSKSTAGSSELTKAARKRNDRLHADRSKRIRSNWTLIHGGQNGGESNG